MVILMDIYLQKTNIVHGAGIHLWGMVALRPVFKTDGYGQVA